MYRKVAAASLLLLATLTCEVKSAAQVGAERAEITALVARMFAAYSREDIAGVMDCWSANSPMFAEVRQLAQEDFAASEELQFSQLTLKRWEVETDRASVRLRFNQQWRDASTKQTARLITNLDVKFVKEAGNWKFFVRRDPSADFAESLHSAKTKEERGKLLKDEKELVTVEMLIAFGRVAVKLAAQGNFDEALRLNDISFEAAEALGEAIGKAHCYFSRGEIFRYQSQHEEALTNYRSALPLFQDAKDKWWETWTLNNLGQVYGLTGRYTDALAHFDAGLRTTREIGDRAGEANMLGNIGNIYQLTGKYSEALTKYQATLEIMRGIGNESGEASTLNNIGVIHKLSGRYAEALAQYDASLKIYRRNVDRAGEATSLNNIGIIYELTGKFAEALAQYDTSLKIKRALGDKAGEANTLGNIANVYHLTGNHTEALTQFDTSLGIMRKLGDRAGEAKTLSNMGLVNRLSGEYAKALTHLEESLKITRAIGDRAGEADTLGNLGGVYALTGKYADALAHYDASLKIMREIGNSAGEARSLVSIAGVYRTQKQWQQAVAYYKQAIPVIELIRIQAREPSLQTGFFAQNTSPYYGLLEGLLELGARRDEIFAAGEQAKARTLVELMSGGKVDVLKSMTDGERRREQALRANFIEASERLNSARSLPNPNRRQIDELKEQVNKARNDYAEFRVKLYIARPGLQVQRADYAPPTLAQLSEPLFSKEPDLCLLIYMVDGGKTFLSVITSGKNAGAPVNLNVYKLKADQNRDLTADELRDRVNALRQRSTNEQGLYKQLAREMYELLLAPAKNELKGRGHVVIIPDGILYALPFQMLIDGQGKHFIESHTVSYAPSVTALLQMTKLADKKKKSQANIAALFAMGRGTFPDQTQYRNSGLPRAEEQVRSIARLFGSTSWVGDEATKAKAVSEMGAARYVHFATHGELNEIAPMESAIVLRKGVNDDGMLYARELLDMELQAELVVLSACDTGRGQAVSGEGILGLTWAMFVAGTPTTVMTEWKVRDDSMNNLMLEFYRQLRLSGTRGQPTISKAEALRRAQLSLMKDGAYQHPYHWAPLVLTGDWR